MAGFSNSPTGDMSGPSVYTDTQSRTIGIATFDAPRVNPNAAQSLTLPSSSQAASWQPQWMLDCATMVQMPSAGTVNGYVRLTNTPLHSNHSTQYAPHSLHRKHIGWQTAGRTCACPHLRTRVCPMPSLIRNPMAVHVCRLRAILRTI
jgi:hypothetical protein